MILAARAALMLGGSSMVAIAMTLATAKGLALLVGPHGVGAFGLFQSLVDLAALFVGLGVSVSLVRLVGGALDRGELERVRAVRAAASLLAWVLGGAGAVVILLFSETIASGLFGSTQLRSGVAAAAIAVPFSLAASTNVAILSAYRHIGAIAALRSIAAVATAGATLLAVWWLGEAGVALGILAASVTLWLGASQVLRRQSQRSSWPDLGRILRIGVELVRAGVTFAASALVGTGLQLAIPIFVALTLSTEAAGFYRAATQISAGYLSFIAASMLQDYYPRLSGEQVRPDVLVALIDQQLKLVLVLTVPLLLVGIAVSDLIVPLLYSEAFRPAVAILGWQLVGTLLKLPSWTLSFAILARGRTGVYFVVELLGGIALVAASLVGMAVLGLPGLGVAVLVAYAIYYPLVWYAVRRDLPLRVTPAQRVLLATTAAALATQLLPAVGLSHLRQPAALVVATVGVAAALYAARTVVAGRLRGPRGRRGSPPQDAGGTPLQGLDSVPPP